MTHSCCPACSLRFAGSGPSECPQCTAPLVALESAEAALGLQLFVDVGVSLPALEAAIAAARARPPWHG